MQNSWECAAIKIQQNKIQYETPFYKEHELAFPRSFHKSILRVNAGLKKLYSVNLNIASLISNLRNLFGTVGKGMLEGGAPRKISMGIDYF